MTSYCISVAIWTGLDFLSLLFLAVMFAANLVFYPCGVSNHTPRLLHRKNYKFKHFLLFMVGGMCEPLFYGFWLPYFYLK